MAENDSLDDGTVQALQVQIASLLQEQAELLGEARRWMEIWTRRRRDAMRASCRTLCGREAEAVAASYGDRLVARMNRVMADIDDARNEALRSAETVAPSLARLTRQ
jgi:hypothetical protein